MIAKTSKYLKHNILKMVECFFGCVGFIFEVKRFLFQERGKIKFQKHSNTEVNK